MLGYAVTQERGAQWPGATTGLDRRSTLFEDSIRARRQVFGANGEAAYLGSKALRHGSYSLVNARQDVTAEAARNHTLDEAVEMGELAVSLTPEERSQRVAELARLATAAERDGVRD